MWLVLIGEGPLECTSCPAHSMLEGGLCMECLGAQYYDPPTQLCKNCHESCHSCSGPGKFSCTACTLPLHLDKLNNQCVPCCSGNEKKTENDECCLCDPETGGFKYYINKNRKYYFHQKHYYYNYWCIYLCRLYEYFAFL